MIKISFKIWSVSNLIVFALFAFALFPQGFEIGLRAVLFSSLFSLPAILIIYLFLQVLHLIQGRMFFSWVILLFGTALTAFVSYSLFNLWSGSEWSELNFILPLSLISGYSAVMILSPSLHNLFLKFQHQNENESY